MLRDSEPAIGRATERKIHVGFAVALAALALVAVMSHLSIVRLNENTRGVQHTHQVLAQLERLISTVTDAETAERGYVITENADYLGRYEQALRRAAEVQRRLVEATADNAVQQQRLTALHTLVEERLKQFSLVFQLRQAEGFEGAQREILKGLGKRIYDQIRELIDQMTATEQTLLRERELKAERSTLLAQSITWGGGVLAFGVVCLAALAIRRDFAGRERAERALRRARDELDLRVRQRTAELQLANESLSHSERRFRGFVSATADVVYRMSPDWSEMRHLEGQEFIPDTTDPSRSWLEKYIHPDDQATVIAAIQEAIRTQTTFELEHRVRRTDGTLGWTFSRAVPLLGEHGEILEWVGAATDVTARKEAESQLQAQLARLALLSQITRAIGERQDVKSIFQVVIRTLEDQLPVDFCAICRYEPSVNELTVASVGRRSEPLAMELAMAERARIPIGENGLLRCVQGQWVYEPRLDGIAFPFPQRLLAGGLNALVAAPLRVESRVFGVLLTARRECDSFSPGECEFLRQVSEHVALATQQAQLYTALQNAYDDLRLTQQAVMQQERLLALGQMASGIAHDINNALSPAGLYTESLLEREPNLSPRTRQYLEIIHRALDDVAHTVSRMREFYRPRESEVELHRLDVNPLLQQVVDLTRARWSDMAHQRGVSIEVRTELASDLPPIMGIESELRDAFTNLIFNAVDAMTQGGPLTLRTRACEVSSSETELPAHPARRLVQVEVIDCGSGMDEETRRRCFEPFFTTKGDRGTGLGLAMVYGAVNRHGAEIQLDSEVGKGTTVRLRFAAATAGNDVIGVGSTMEIPPLRILLVDDDPLVLSALEAIVAADGHTVASADGGQAGIDAFLAAQSAGEPFQVVMTDLGMPHVDGRRVSAAVKEADPNTVVLLLTGWGQRLLATGDIPEHVDRVLSKPPKVHELRETLAQTLAGRG